MPNNRIPRQELHGFQKTESESVGDQGSPRSDTLSDDLQNIEMTWGGYGETGHCWGTVSANVLTHVEELQSLR